SHAHTHAPPDAPSPLTKPAVLSPRPLSEPMHSDALAARATDKLLGDARGRDADRLIMNWEPTCSDSARSERRAPGQRARPTRPTRAPPSTSSAGLIRVESTRAKTAIARLTVTQPVSAPRPRLMQPARISPTDTGASPRWIASRQDQPSSRRQSRPTARVISAVGARKATTAASAPRGPATCAPIAVTIIMLGPG